MGLAQIALQIQTRIDLLFTMSEITHARPVRTATCEVMFRGRLFEVASSSHSVDQTIWWSQTGSNRRPHACKARALPAELWPRTRRRMLAAASLAWPLRSEPTRSKWWAWEDLNFRPHAYQARALTN